MNRFSLAIAVPEVNPLEGWHLGTEMFLHVSTELTMKLAGMTLHAPVDPVDLDLQGHGRQNAGRGVLINDERDQGECWGGNGGGSQDAPIEGGRGCGR